MLRVILVGLVVFTSTLHTADGRARCPVKTPYTATSIAENIEPYELPITISQEGHIFVKADIDGVEGNFVLDTGAGLNAITAKFASKLDGLREDGYFTGFRATGEPMELKIYKADNLVIGNLHLHDPSIAIIDADLGKIDGLISLTCFRHTPFTIDFSKKKIHFETKNSLIARQKAGIVVPVQFDDDRGISLDMFTKVRVNDTLTLQISLDSGAGFNVYRINAAFMKRLGIDTTAAAKYIKKSTLNSKVTNLFYVARLNELSLSAAPSVQIRNIKTSFLNGLIYDGITCINWLGKQITIDIPDKEMIVR